MVGGLLLLVVGALSVAAYLEVRRSTVAAATTRLQALAQQLASQLRTSATVSVEAVRGVGENEVVKNYLSHPAPRLKTRTLEALQYRGQNLDQILAVELRDAGGRRLLSWGPAAERLTSVVERDLVDAIVRRDPGSVGAFRALGDSVVYPVFGPVTDPTVIGYVVQWRLQTATEEGRRAIAQLLGPDARLFLGDTSQAFWTDMVAMAPTPPMRLPLGTEILEPPVVHYDRPGEGAHFAAAARAEGTAWVALVEFPRAYVMEPSDVFLGRLIAAASGFMMLALLAVILGSRSLTRPLRELAAAADAITRGEHSRRVGIERKDELGRVARAFNRLAEDVQVTTLVREARFRLLVEAVLDYAIFALDTDGNVLTWNAGAERLKGYTEEEIVGRHFSVFYPPEDKASAKPHRELVIAKAEGRVQDEGWRLRKDGSRFWALVIITALRDEDGKLVGFGKVTRDMSERREAEERLRESNQALRQRTVELDQTLVKLQHAQESLVRREKLAILGQLASGVGHELRNPLGVMMNSVYYLDAVLENAPPNVKEYLGILRGQIDLSEKIVSDLLDFARVKPPQQEPVRLPELVQRQLERVGSLNGVRLRLDITADLPLALGDQVQVGQIVLNLLTNAVQAMGDRGGLLAVRGSRDGPGNVQLEVSDTGPGIPLENLERIFEPLFTTKARGMGLGLAVSRALAVANGGDIKVRSETGKGATFTLVLPTSEDGRKA